MSAELGIVIQESAALEQILTDHFAADGKGFGEKLKSVQHQLPRSLVERLWQIVHVRNKAAHNAIAPPDINEFQDRCNIAKAELKRLIPSKTPVPQAPVLRATLPSNALPNARARKPSSASGKGNFSKVFIIFTILFSGFGYLYSVLHDYDSAATATPQVTSMDHFEGKKALETRIRTTHHVAHHHVAHHHPDNSFQSSPLFIKARKGHATYVLPNSQHIVFSKIRAVYVHNYHGVVNGWGIKGIIKNNSHSKIYQLWGVAYFRVPHRSKTIGPIDIVWRFKHGLPSGKAQAFTVLPGDAGIGIAALDDTSVRYAKSLGAIICKPFDKDVENIAAIWRLYF